MTFGRDKFGRKRARQRGFSLIETMMAMGVLSIGMMGGATMILAAQMTNNRNKLDEGATVIAQNVMEQILQNGNSGGNLALTDCLGNAFTIATGSAAAPGSGAPLTASGAIDYSQATVANYSMIYNSCKASGDPVPYDVRWNVTTLRTSVTGAGVTAHTTIYTKQVSIAARPTGAGSGNGSIRAFALPVTLRGTAAAN